nr:reverse transcriptase domain-containing protein [Tanacetum cinerariifolium]
MRTRSSSNLSGESSPNPTSSNPKRRNRRRSKQPFILEESPVDTMTDQHTMAESLRASTEGYAKAIVDHHEAIFLEKEYPALNPADQDSLNSAAGGNLLERRTQDVLTNIENKSKVRNSRNKSIVSQVKSSDANSSSFSEIAKLTHAVNQQTSAVTTAMTTILKQFQATPPPAFVKAVEEICVTCGGAHPYYQSFVKAVEEICVTCGGAHPYYQCLAADGKNFSELRDNIQGYVESAAVNYNQGNSGYRPLGVANQIRPSSFAQPNVQNNQNRFSQPQGHNGGNNFNQDQSYQTPTQQNQVVPLSELEKIKRINEANMKAMQTQSNNVKNELRNEMKNSIQLQCSGPLPSNTIANPKGELKDITTRSGIVLDGCSILIPPPFINPEEDERVEETLTDPDLAEYTIKVPPPLKMIKALLSNKEKLLELANTPLNENCSAVILKKLLEKLGDPVKFLILCGFSELKCKALADLGASINLMPLSVWKKLGLLELISTRMTLELANQAICTQAGITRDVFVSVGKFTFPADFVIVDYESDPRVPLILGRPFLRTARALIDVHGEEIILRDGNDDIPFDIESDLKEIEYLLNHDPIKDMDSIIKDSINESNLADLYDNLVDTMPEMFTDKHALDYSSPPLYDEYDDDLFEVESDTENLYDDPFDSKGRENQRDFSEVDALFLTNNEAKIIAISHASLIIEDFDPPLYELPFHKEIPGPETLLSFSSKNEEKVFKLGILNFKGVHSSLLPELSH